MCVWSAGFLGLPDGNGDERYSRASPDPSESCARRDRDILVNYTTEKCHLSNVTKVLHLLLFGSDSLHSVGTTINGWSSSEYQGKIRLPNKVKLW